LVAGWKYTAGTPALQLARETDLALGTIQGQVTRLPMDKATLILLLMLVKALIEFLIRR
jgi:hypothetical protein